MAEATAAAATFTHRHVRRTLMPQTLCEAKGTVTADPQAGQ